MSIHDDDVLFNSSVDYAADLIRGGTSFYDAVSKASQSFKQDWFEIQQALADRSADARSYRASKKNSVVDEIKALTKAYRAKQKEKPQPPLQKPLF